MCGIAGVLTREPLPTGMGEPLDAMRRALRHRGPDGDGAWQSPSGGAGFVHTRLAVFDPSPQGGQPMSIDGRYTITYNGALYNFRALRRALEQRGVAFRTATDTEVIVRSYEAYGPACVAQLRGMFAFALWDERERTCLMARDRFGIKPLYFSDRRGRLVFASEVRALAASHLVPRELSADAVYGYLRTGSVPEPLTLLRDVGTFAPGHYGIWRDGQLSVTPYWTLTFSENGLGQPSPVAQVRDVLLDSVACHFAGDRPVGLFLSGGLDSTALLALAHTAGHGPLRTFSMTFPGSLNDEGPAARQTAAQFGAHHEECAVDAPAAKAWFGQFVAAQDQPSIDGLNTFIMSKFARDRGMTVVWSGLGADELFGGYPSFQQVPRLAAWHRRATMAGPLSGYVGRLVEAAAPGARLRRIGDLLDQPPGLDAAYATFRGVYTRAESRSIAAHFAGDPPAAAVEPHAATSEGASADAVSRMELTRYVRNQLLRDADIMSMTWGLELRTPFLDSAVVDSLATIPHRARLEPGKGLLRRAVPEVPPWVASAGKQCFQFPFEHWIDRDWRDVFSRFDRIGAVPAQTWYRKWCVYVLDEWMGRMKVSRHE